MGMAVKKAGFGTLLFDESEKAHPRVLDILLQILDAARITIATGETLDVSGFYVVLTSNLDEAPHHQVLVNLGAPVPAQFARFERLIEIIGSEDDELAAGRERFRFYRDRGYAIEMHKQGG